MTKYEEQLNNIVKKAYNNDISKINDAATNLKYANKLKTVSGDLSKFADRIMTTKDLDETNWTCIDLVHHEGFVHPGPMSSTVLAYTLNYFASKRVLPFTLQQLVDHNYTADRKRNRTDEARRVFNEVKHRMLNAQLEVQNYSLDRKNGTLTFNTRQRDYRYGYVQQSTVVKLDAKKLTNIDGIRGTVLEMSRNYDMLLSYFMLLGFSSIHCRCTCPEYIQNHSKMKGISNYFCSHIMYSMTQLPWYMLQLLK